MDGQEKTAAAQETTAQSASTTAAQAAQRTESTQTAGTAEAQSASTVAADVTTTATRQTDAADVTTAKNEQVNAASTTEATTADTKAEDTKAVAKPDVSTLTGKLADAELRVAAAVAGVSAERIPYLVRMCDAGKLTAEGADMKEAAATQIAEVLAAIPELAGAFVSGSVGDHRKVGSSGQMTDEEKVAQAFQQGLKL